MEKPEILFKSSAHNVEDGYDTTFVGGIWDGNHHYKRRFKICQTWERISPTGQYYVNRFDCKVFERSESGWFLVLTYEEIKAELRKVNPKDGLEKQRADVTANIETITEIVRQINW